MEYLERGMQRIRMACAKLQQDPTQTQVISRIGNRPKKVVNQQDYNFEGEQGSNQEIFSVICAQVHTHNRATDTNRCYVIKAK